MPRKPQEIPQEYNFFIVLLSCFVLDGIDTVLDFLRNGGESLPFASTVIGYGFEFIDIITVVFGIIAFKLMNSPQIVYAAAIVDPMWDDDPFVPMYTISFLIAHFTKFDIDVKQFLTRRN